MTAISADSQLPSPAMPRNGYCALILDFSWPQSLTGKRVADLWIKLSSEMAVAAA